MRVGPVLADNIVLTPRNTDTGCLEGQSERETSNNTDCVESGREGHNIGREALTCTVSPGYQSFQTATYRLK